MGRLTLTDPSTVAGRFSSAGTQPEACPVALLGGSVSGYMQPDALADACGQHLAKDATKPETCSAAAMLAHKHVAGDVNQNKSVMLGAADGARYTAAKEADQGALPLIAAKLLPTDGGSTGVLAGLAGRRECFPAGL